jgi:hypothetical protein
MNKQFQEKVATFVCISETQNTFSQALNQHGDKPSKPKNEKQLDLYVN